MIDFTTGAKTPTDNSFTKSRKGDQVSLLLGVFGPNASGKTNLLKVVSFLNFFLFGSYSEARSRQRVPVDGFIGSKDSTKLTLEFEGGKAVYRYEVVLKEGRIHEERLRRWHPKTRSFRIVLSRKDGPEGIRLTQPAPFTDMATLRRLLKDRPDASMIAVGLVTGRKEFKELASAIGPIETNVHRGGKRDFAHASQTQDLIEYSRYLNENPEHKAGVEERLADADLGIAALVIREIEFMDNEGGEQKKEPFPFVIHKTAEGEFELPLSQESSGTKRLFALLRFILPILSEGGVAVIDEMESDLHPHLIPLLLGLFSDPETNPHQAQLLFTCHHVEILNHLLKEQIILVQKNENNESEAYRLSEVKGVRRDANHFASYNSGCYEAVPEPSLF